MTNPIQSKRIEWIDISKGILIALVVLGHIMPLGHFNKDDIGESMLGALRMWIYACHIPAFFIVSGVLKNRLGYCSKVGDFMSILKKQKLLFLYYIFFSLIFFVRYALQTYLGQYSTHDLVMFLYNSISFVGMGVLWFIPTFILSDLLFYILINGGKKARLLYSLSLLILIISTFFYEIHGIATSTCFFIKIVGLVYRTFIGTSFMIAGLLLDRCSSFNSKYLYIGLLSVLCVVNGNVDLNNLYFQNIILYYIFAITGALLVFGIAKIVSKIGGILSYILSNWGGDLCSSCVLTQYCLSYRQVNFYVVNSFQTKK